MLFFGTPLLMGAAAEVAVRLGGLLLGAARATNSAVTAVPSSPRSQIRTRHMRG
jgi:hypothetical protein